MRRVIALATLAAAALTGPAMAQQKLAGEIRIDGSSTVFPISQAVAEEFAAAAPRVHVTVGQSGTGGGFKQFTAGETDVSNASRPIKKEERDAAVAGGVEFIELPVAYDGLTIVVHPRNTWVDTLTLDDIRRIFVDGAYARTWKDVNPAWPDKPIQVYAPGTDSGTFDYFKEVVAGSAGAMRPGMSVSEDDNILVKGVAGNENAIGFFGCAYYFENRTKVKAVKVDAGHGPVAPTPETIESGAYAPFSRPLFIYVSAKAAKRPEVRAFVEFYLEHAPELAAEVGYVALPPELYRRAAANLADGRTGTRFLTDQGEKVHGPLTTVYR